MPKFKARKFDLIETLIVYWDMVTDGNTKLCCRGFVLALFQSTTAYKIDSEHTRDNMKYFPVCKVEILQVTGNKIEV